MYNCDNELIYDITDGKSLLGNIAHIESLNEMDLDLMRI